MEQKKKSLIDVISKWSVLILTIFLLPLCSIVYGFITSDINTNTKKIERIEKEMRTGEILEKIEGLEKLFNTKIDALNDKIDK